MRRRLLASLAALALWCAPAIAAFHDRAAVTSATTGTGTVTLGSAISGPYQSFSASGVTNGESLRYIIVDGNAWETGTGTYSSTGPTLTRTPQTSSNSGSAITLDGSETVYIGATAADLNGFLTSVTGGSGLTCSASGSVVTCTPGVPDVAKTTAYTVQATDMAGTISLGTCSSGCTLTVPAISGTILASNMSVCFSDVGTSNWTLSTTPAINGLPSTTIYPKGGGCLVSNGTSLDWQPGHIGGDFASYGTLTAAIDALFGSTQGGVLYRGASAWSMLAPPGSAGAYCFTITGGSGNNPSWGSCGGSSTPCSDLKADHETATGTPTIYACDVVMQPEFGL